ncbi:unnamed protein product [Effrenium voratum]|nr:unnamed protein product [Effrenium voratum]
MGSGAMKHALQPAGEKAASSPAATAVTAVTEATEVMEEEEDEEAIYEAHREELLAMLRSGGQAKLQARTPGGVGLLNQGATCYMNSLLQSLFNIPEFRLAVYQFEHDPQLHGDAARCIPMQLQRLFAQLQLSKASAVSTKELTAACGFSGRDAMEQHDVQELCRVLFDALEKSSSLLAKVIQDLYAGQRTYYIKCREEVDGNAYESKRRETYLDLQIPIQDCKSLPEALHKFLEPEVLSGDNQWFCEQLGRKVDALSGTTVDSLPQILCLHLLRFVFDMQTARRRKLTELLEIPLDLDLGFMKGGQYHLSAVCLHSGTAHGGHYHSFIRDPSGEWKDANDSRVTILGQQQCDSLFSGERPALHSSDAYFLLYRAEGAGSPPKVQDGEVPGRAEIFEENQRLQQLQRVYELHRRLLEVKIFVPCAAELFLRSYVSAQLHGLVEPVEAQEMCVSIKTLDRQPESLLRRAQKALSEMDADWAKVPLASARLYELDRRGLPGRPLEELEQVKELLLCEGSDWGGLEPTFLCLWDNELTAPSTAPGRVAALRLATEPKAAKAASAELASAQAGYNDQVKGLEETYELGQEEMPDLFADTAPTRPVGGSASPLLRDVRLAAAARWSLPVDGVVLVAMSGMQAGHELKDDAATLLECGCAPGDVLCVELMEGPGVPRAVQLFEEKRNTAQVFFNHPGAQVRPNRAGAPRARGRVEGRADAPRDAGASRARRRAPGARARLGRDRVQGAERVQDAQVRPARGRVQGTAAPRRTPEGASQPQLQVEPGRFLDLSS